MMRAIAARLCWVASLSCCILGMLAFQLTAAEPAAPVTFENLQSPGENSKDEPLAAEYSSALAGQFLDTIALDWQKSRDCMTCHTNYAYLMARPQLDASAPAHQIVRDYAEKLVEVRWPEKGPRWNAEVIATATVLAMNDAATSGQLHPTTRKALDKMWELQKEDGGWEWLKCDWPPMESDDHYGVTFAALGVGQAPEEYRKTPQAQAGIAKLRTYLEANPAPTLHHQGMQLWAAAKLPELMTQEARQMTIQALIAKQNDDGGWGAATLGNWQREDGSAQDPASDGYGTGFVIVVLRSAGVPANDPAIAKGIAWLKSHQRASGRWYTRSLFKDSKHFLTHAGTAYAVMALASCEE